MKDLFGVPNSFALDDLNHVWGVRIDEGEMDTCPETLVKLKNLKTLLIIDSEFSDVSSLSQLKGLTELVLFRCLINNISSLNQLKNLKFLDLSRNKITHLPAELLDLGMKMEIFFACPLPLQCLSVYSVGSIFFSSTGNSADAIQWEALLHIHTGPILSPPLHD